MPRLALRAAAAAGLLLAGGTAAASSYLLSEEELYYRGALGASSASQAFDASGQRTDLACDNERTTLDNTLEYGASYWHTLFGHVALAQARCGDRQRQGVGDVTLGMRGRLVPDQNYRAWELDVTIPTDRGAGRVGCGVFGAGVNVERADRPSRYVTLAYGASLQLWQAPLAHRFALLSQVGGPLGVKEYTPWSWMMGLSGEVPLVDRPVDPAARADDCGTQSQALRLSSGLRYRTSREVTLGCTFDAVLAGRDVNQALGLSCGYSYLWH